MAERSRTLRLEGGRGERPGNVRRFRLTPVEGGESWLSSTDRCAIGADALNDLVLRDPTVSRFHCEVRLAPEGARVRDLGSLNGTFIAGRGRLGRDQLYKLRDRDELVLGGTKLEFRKG